MSPTAKIATAFAVGFGVVAAITWPEPSRGATRHSDPRPRAWCGWGLKRYLGLHDLGLNLARNWTRVGRPSSPRAGAIVVYPHHVGQIIQVTHRGRAIVHSFNDGNRERTRERSLRGAIAFRQL